jgi:hypothetical protein
LIHEEINHPEETMFWLKYLGVVIKYAQGACILDIYGDRAQTPLQKEKKDILKIYPGKAMPCTHHD